MTARRYILLACLLVMSGFAGANLLVQDWLSGARIDFTGGKLYTLSDGTRATLDKLSEPVELTFVYTRSVGQDFPSVQAYAVRVRELLETYANLAGGNIIFREIDPEPFSEAEDEALAAGLVAIDTNGSDPLYFGLIGRNSVDDERVVPFLAPERETSLEYDLTRMVARLDRPEPPRIGLLTTIPGMSTVTPEAGYVILQEMDKSFTVEPIEENFVTLPPEIDVLMLAHPPQLSAWQQWQIDQFILRKGRALILLDPAAKTAQGTGPFNQVNRQIRSDLNRFEQVWGVSLSQDAIADTQTALPIEAEDEEGRATILKHPLFLSIPPGLMSADSLITADLARALTLGAAGRLRLFDDAPGDREILLQSGPAPSYIPASSAANDLSARDTLAIYEPTPDGPAVLGVRVTGSLVSAFPDGPPPADAINDPIYGELARAAVEEALPHIATSSVDAQIIILSDVDMLDDGLHLNMQTGVPFADNGAFILNALDSLSGGSDLMSLRARAPGLRPMVRIDRMRAAAQEKYFDQQSRLEARLEMTQQRLEELQTVGATGDFFEGEVGAELSLEERTELARLREDIVSTRAKLRQIERDFRKGIDALELRLRLFTILTGPLIMGLMGLFIWWRNRRWRSL